MYIYILISKYRYDIHTYMHTYMFFTQPYGCETVHVQGLADYVWYMFCFFCKTSFVEGAGLLSKMLLLLL